MRRFLIALALLAVLASLPGPRYLLTVGRGQLALMTGTTPLAEAAADPRLSDAERRALGWVPEIKRFGESVVGLSPTKNYERVNLGFDAVVWNVSACAHDRFESHVYRYPVVGALPYIGFFDPAHAAREARRLEGLGWEVHVRPAGAYSTLGWFRDPLWRSMLRWGREQLSNTVLHELAHATVWIPGEGAFNESFAAFVGDEASRRYLQSLDDRAAFEGLMAIEADRERYVDRMHRLADRLEGLFGAGLGLRATLALKERLIEAEVRDWRRAPWRLEGYREVWDRRPPSNPQLAQFRVYRTGGDDFGDALQRFGGDLRAFVAACRELPAQKRRAGRGWDAYEALKRLAPG